MYTLGRRLKQNVDSNSEGKVHLKGWPGEGDNFQGRLAAHHQ